MYRVKEVRIVEHPMNWELSILYNGDGVYNVSRATLEGVFQHLKEVLQGAEQKYV